MNVDKTPEDDVADWLKHVALNRKISRAQHYAIVLLAVQQGDAKWMSLADLKAFGVMLRTLQAMKRDGLVDSAEAETFFRISRFGQAWVEHREAK